MDQTMHFNLLTKGSLTAISFAVFQAMEVPQALFFFLLLLTLYRCRGSLCSYKFPLKSCCNMHQKKSRECSKRLEDRMEEQGWMKYTS